MPRKYRILQMRVILYQQDVLRELEDELLSLDVELKTGDARLLSSRELLDAHDNYGFQNLIHRIDSALSQHGRYTCLVLLMRHT